MGEVKRYTLSAFMDEREDGLYVDREDYDAVERERDALRADLQATREALHEWDNRVGRLQDEVAALKAAQANMIDASGAVEGRVQKLPVPASGWAGGTSLEHVTIPREWAGDRVLIVRVAK